MSFLPLHVGLRIKMTKKIFLPELVQECPSEILDIQLGDLRDDVHWPF